MKDLKYILLGAGYGIVLIIFMNWLSSVLNF